MDRARVLIVGLGGLGSPVMQYLAGAGIGFLGLIDADVLDASNLHRQPIYGLADVGKAKADLARAAIAAINPAVQVEAHAVPFNADNALELIRRHDIVVDCSDNFRTKYLINDAAVLAQKPAVFASVYQYEGQLQVYKPEPMHACLRCLWPDALADGVVGNCAEAGVLGPVPGGIRHAAGTAHPENSVADGRAARRGVAAAGLHEFFQPENQSFAPRRVPRAGMRAHPGSGARGPRHRSQLGFTGRCRGARLRGHRYSNRRGSGGAPGRRAAGTTVSHIPMQELLANPRLAAGRQALLVCATGKRSLATARALRKQGLAVRSLAGGLQNLEH